jgi:hypothetical protein
MRKSGGVVVLVLAQGLAGCEGPGASTPVPQASTPVAQPAPAPISVVVFVDPASGFSTSDVRDVQEQIVRFNTASELIWVADDTRFSGYRVNGNKVRGPGPEDYFQVRFGTKNGEQRAYLGWDDDYCHCPGFPMTVLDIEVIGGRLITAATDVVVPGT